MDFSFTQRQPSGRLARYVESVWHARGQISYARERIAPTGSTVAGIVLGPPIRQIPSGGSVVTADTGFLIGPHDRPPGFVPGPGWSPSKTAPGAPVIVTP